MQRGLPIGGRMIGPATRMIAANTSRASSGATIIKRTGYITLPQEVDSTVLFQRVVSECHHIAAGKPAAL